MDPSSLYREEMFTDRKMGAIRVLTPVKSDGTPDGTRKVLYIGETQLLTQAGLLPLVFELDATSLADAVELFASGAADAVERTRRELEDLRREAASSIITPDRMPGLLGGPGGPPAVSPAAASCGCGRVGRTDEVRRTPATWRTHRPRIEPWQWPEAHWRKLVERGARRPHPPARALEETVRAARSRCRSTPTTRRTSCATAASRSAGCAGGSTATGWRAAHPEAAAQLRRQGHASTCRP